MSSVTIGRPTLTFVPKTKSRFEWSKWKVSDTGRGFVTNGTGRDAAPCVGSCMFDLFDPPEFQFELVIDFPF
jgi:hypothetical protein